MSNLFSIADALCAPDPSPFPLRQLWMDRCIASISSLSHALHVAALRADPITSPIISDLRARLLRLPSRSVGLACSSPVAMRALGAISQINSDISSAALSPTCGANALDQTVFQTLVNEFMLITIDAELHANIRPLNLLAPSSMARLLCASGNWFQNGQVFPVEKNETVLHGTSTVFVSSKDSVLGGDAIDRYPKLPEGAQSADFACSFQAALHLLSEFSPGFHRSCEGLLRVAVPMQIPKVGVPSASSNELPGAFCLTAVKDHNLLTEQIVHECSHAFLFLLQELDPLLDISVHGDGWGEPLEYSPWRDDLRPLNGLLHGLVVFTRVAWFHARARTAANSHNESMSLRRLAALLPQLEVGLSSLGAKASFTSTGARLFRGLKDSIALLRRTIDPATQQTEPFYMECSSIQQDSLCATERQRAHLLRSTISDHGDFIHALGASPIQVRA